MKHEMLLKVEQKLSQELIQSLKLLQMPSLDLAQMTRQELTENLFLEEEESSEAPDRSDPRLDKIDWEDHLRDEGEFYVRTEKEEGTQRLPRTPISEKTLHEHLTDQLHLSSLRKKDVLIGEYIVGNIDENGYLVFSVEEIAKDTNTSAERISEILSVIQTFDPPGVGARDSKEALLVQIMQGELKNTLAYPLVRDHFYDLVKSNRQLAKILKVSEKEVQAAKDSISQRLNPPPPAREFSRASPAVLPDLVVEKIDDQFVVYYNDRNVPRVRISRAYRRLVRKDSPCSEEDKAWMRKDLENARRFKNRLDQRRSTMIKVMESIVSAQKEFFEQDPSRLKPLTMRVIADEIGMHLTTVYRAAKDKYVQTPDGVFEIKYFFDGGIPTENGETSRRNIKRRIDELIKTENPSSPLSDQKIFQQLKKEGIGIARRTVTKYREDLKIKTARQRKRS